ncbi:hypothetical protein WMY93_001880 [Mugilogobius chulae]|uniref:G-protein coupled receptors family 2 profile 2 domain-containing protein n=1 Tax=Mugilogobius chulae TaxID=88201 RepID=A0AAW0PVA9_9GOBI
MSLQRSAGPDKTRLLLQPHQHWAAAELRQPCRQPYFSTEEHAFTGFWIGLWSVLCFLSTLTTVATFLIDMERFKYPERPIIFLATCYFFVSLGYIIRLVAGHERVACSNTSEPPHILYDTTGPALCTLVFLLIYFFGMASSIWWVVLSFTWFLAAGLKWGSEASLATRSISI